MNDLLIIGFRTFFLYFFILLVLRVMGKREVGELGILDVVVFIIMAEVAAIAIEDPRNKLFHTVFPILLLLVIQLISSFISLKSKKFRDLVDGDPSVIIRNGKILEGEMRRQRYNLDDLFQQLREQQIGSVREVTFAFLEPSGNLSVFTKEDTQPVLALISDGIIQNRHIEIVGVTEQQLVDELTKLGINDIKHIFYCSYEKGTFQYQLKEEFQ
ncbi:DUF421 domain-containing protein [Sporosarcina sp. Marseille-Q4063]|uniref:DUF421 domain-containing protein n=1 Tax=Sporosarcina sp. Marseille-Q4063 TaxID=2810514 RepID=UPI001BAF60B8|nr:DUF421 domain-containing protein [Sporosarcina sp. Marseille-Q4063]QUW22464.1 DUF421 domain-containing protein [Sporosarcina sp. Marseille-Q4063]